MKTKIIQFVPALFALIGLTLAQSSYHCIYSTGSCYGTWINNIYQYFTNPFYNFSLYFLPLAIILIFIPRHLFNSWFKFALWALPLAFIFIATTPVNWTGIGINFFPFYRDDAARLAGGVFSAASLVLIICRALRSARTE